MNPFHHFFLIDPCEYIQYGVNTLPYDSNSHIQIVSGKGKYQGKLESKEEEGLMISKDNDEIETEKGYKEVLFYYSSTSVKVISQEKILDFSNFLSAIGGNLGLFVGFSFLGFFTCLYDLIIRLWAHLPFICNR